MPTDLRAALRDAAAMLARVKPIDLNVGDDPHGLAERCRALADAPATVAELLPLVDVTHVVHWTANGEDRRAIDGGDGQIHFQWRTGDGSRWRDHVVNCTDLTHAAQLVEVTP